MKVMAFDPGATRMGWAVITQDDGVPAWEAHGIFGVERKRNESKVEPYQQYRLRLIDFWIRKTPELLERYRPDKVAYEIVPPVGSGNFVTATQSQLAATAITVVVVVARQGTVDVEQIGATSVKARIGGSKKATKVAVRNGVFALLPETERFRKEWTTMFDASDACGVALTNLGLDVRKR